MARNIRDDIVHKRRQRLAELGHEEGAPVPAARQVPIVPFLGSNGLICEVKRRSPSKGDIAPGLDARDQAAIYYNAGARNFSVLTEPEGFAGNIGDLIHVKQTFPDAAVLRKDFLLDTEDIDVAHRAGADAVLLIAGILDADTLAAMHARARELGMAALVEVHDAQDIAKARTFKPELVGINSRDLTTFSVDPLIPLMVASAIDWPCRLVYESGVSHPDHAAFAVASGFTGVLVGEWVVRDPALAGALLTAMGSATPSRFWRDIGASLAKRNGSPLVKICGIAHPEDAQLAASLGADILGFVLYEKSPRRADLEVLRAVRDIPLPKVLVVVNDAGAQDLPEVAKAALAEGLADAVQFHGAETPDDCTRLYPTYFKALRPTSTEFIREADLFRCPRILLDAAAEVPGGSGKAVRPSIMKSWKRPLWLAGGITPDNVRGIVRARRPELIDLASGVEDRPGRKSPDRLRALFAELADLT